MNWSAVASPSPHLGLSNTVWALTTYDDGSGPALYVGGDFATAGEAFSPNAAKLTPAGWQALGAGPSGAVRALCGFNDGSGPKLCAAITSAPGVRCWDGTSWTTVGTGFSVGINALVAFDDGSGPALYAGGPNSVRRWNGASWGLVGTVNNEVLALAVHDDGSGQALYAAGRFTSIGGVAANRIAKWNGTSWSALGLGLGTAPASQRVTTMVSYPTAGGTVLAAGGIFSSAGGSAGFNLAIWNGASWSALNTGEYIEKLLVYDNGTGPALYGGLLYKSKPMRWAGATWVAVDGAAPLDGVVHALAAFDDGSGGGSDLYAGGGGFLEGGPISLGVSVLRGCAGPGRMFCFGDNSSGPCPCNNSGTYGRGCANSEIATGAILSSSGTIVPDTVVLAAEGVKSGVLCAFLQGTVPIAPIVFGDGLRCTGGSLHRLYTKPATGTSVVAPQGAEPPITIRSASLGDPITPTSLRYYQVYYRDGVASFCPSPPGSNWNVSGALEVQW